MQLLTMRYYINRSVTVLYRWVVLILILYILKLNYNRKIKIKEFNTTVSKPITTYRWFMNMKDMFMDLGEEDTPVYRKDTPFCRLNISSLGPIVANKSPVNIRQVGEELPDVKKGGYHAPLHCKSRHKVAILVTYRDRKTNLAIFLRHMHPFLTKQLLEYRIFVIEQYGQGKFNKGALYNVGFLESQRFGKWHCYIFHDVDLLPLDGRILYSCPRRPTHMSTAVEAYGFKLPYLQMFGGVTVLKTSDFIAVNGYSNMYLDWGAEDDDMFIRLQSRRYAVVRYNQTIGRYATLPHEPSKRNYWRFFFLNLAKRRFREEGLETVKYRMMTTNKRRLYTYVLADVSPLEE